jgi:hypothetical protein
MLPPRPTLEAEVMRFERKPMLTLGPILGHVTDTTARIMAEVGRDTHHVLTSTIVDSRGKCGLNDWVPHISCVHKRQSTISHTPTASSPF